MSSATETPVIAAEDSSATSENHSSQSLRYSVAEAMQRYFADLDGQDTRDLYELVMAEVEPPLLSAAMDYTQPESEPSCRNSRPKSRHTAQKIKTVRPSVTVTNYLLHSLNYQLFNPRTP